MKILPFLVIFFTIFESIFIKMFEKIGEERTKMVKEFVKMIIADRLIACLQFSINKTSAILFSNEVFSMAKLIMMRHGESQWNKLNLFTGWVDVPLSEKGIQEAFDGGEKIK